MAVTRIVPDLTSRALAEATAFYVDVLGLEVVMDHGWIVTLADPARPEVQLSLMSHDATAPVVRRPRSRSTTWTRRTPLLSGGLPRSCTP